MLVDEWWDSNNNTKEKLIFNYSLGRSNYILYGSNQIYYLEREIYTTPYVLITMVIYRFIIDEETRIKPGGASLTPIFSKYVLVFGNSHSPTLRKVLECSFIHWLNLLAMSTSSNSYKLYINSSVTTYTHLQTSMLERNLNSWFVEAGSHFSARLSTSPPSWLLNVSEKKINVSYNFF